jgi:hypothetical protein
MLVTASLACHRNRDNLLAGEYRRRLQEIIADNLSKAGFSWGCMATVDREGRTMFVADAHRSDEMQFIVHADEKLNAFVELELAIRTGERQGGTPKTRLSMEILTRSH